MTRNDLQPLIETMIEAVAEAIRSATTSAPPLKTVARSARHCNRLRASERADPTEIYRSFNTSPTRPTGRGYMAQSRG